MNDGKVRMAQRLRMARAQTALTQRDVSAQLGVQQSTVHRWEAGDVSPRDATLARLLAYYREHGAQVTESWVRFGHGTDDDADPPYPAWAEFISWLATHPERARIDDQVLANLRGFRAPPGKRPTLAFYQASLSLQLTMLDED